MDSIALNHEGVNPTLTEALRLAALGYTILPLHTPTDGVCSCGNSTCGTHAGKHPRVEGWQRKHTSNPETITTWYGQWPTANVGILTDFREVIIDIDPKNGGKLEDIGEVPLTPTCRSGSGGWRLWFSLPEDFRDDIRTHLREQESLVELPGIDLLNDRQVCVMPPSLHFSGSFYVWEEGKRLGDIPVAVLPPQLLARVRKPSPRRLKGTPWHGKPWEDMGKKWYNEALAKARPGNRHNTCLDMVRQLRNSRVPEDTARAYVHNYQAQVEYLGPDPYPLSDALRVFDDIFFTEPQEPARTQKTAPTVATATVPPSGLSEGPYGEGVPIGPTDSSLLFSSLLRKA
jgi:Bifunctional DNA primase/polymerase, N-terminal